tara:strand:+ start:3106 stop:4179 length:1074 start_codon:yes stop_codon:yes gene_type:complete
MTVLQAKPISHTVKADARTAFVLGNGPSLKGMDLHRLDDFTTIGMNAAYRYWRQIDWRPTYYACLDLVVGMSHKDEIAGLIKEGRIKRFLLRSNLVDALGDTGRDTSVIDFDVLRERVQLLNPPVITTGSHAALWAASMGCSQIVLLGIDGRYVEMVGGAERRDGIELEIVKPGANPNYFFDGYQQLGDRYNIPNPRPGVHQTAWRDAARNLIRARTPVFNGSAHSDLRVFPFVSIDGVLDLGAVPTPADEILGGENEAPSKQLGEPSTERQTRLKAFIRQAKWQTSVVVTATLMCVFGPLSSGVTVNNLAIAGTACLAGAGLLLLLYTRKVVVGHLAQIQEQVDRLQARLRAVERN